MKKMIISLVCLTSVGVASSAFASASTEKNIQVRIDSVTVKNGEQISQITPETAQGFDQCSVKLAPNEESKHIVLTVIRGKQGSKNKLTCQHT
jgi:hypothetical protein